MIESFYPGINSFYNSVYALNIALETYMSNLVLEQDLTRIVYSSTGFALRKRAEVTENNRLDLPFLNYKLTNGGIDIDVDRDWFSHIGHVDGIYVPELRRKVRFVPVRLSYDCNLWLSQEVDTIYTNYMMFWEATNETVIKYELEIDGKVVNMIGILNLELGYDTQFEENDWLEKNDIRNLEMNFTIDTYFIKDNDIPISLSKEIIFTFFSKKELTGDNQVYAVEQYFAGS